LVLIFDIDKIANISGTPPTEEEIDDHIICIENIIKRTLSWLPVWNSSSYIGVILISFRMLV